MKIAVKLSMHFPKSILNENPRFVFHFIIYALIVLVNKTAELESDSRRVRQTCHTDIPLLNERRIPMCL